MNRRALVLMLFVGPAGMSQAGGCAELAALNAAAVRDRDIQVDPLAAAVRTAVTLPSAPSRMQEKLYPHEYQFSWGQSERSQSRAAGGRRAPQTEKLIKACLDHALQGAQDLAFRRKADEAKGDVYQLRVSLRYVYLFLDHNDQRELGKRNWAGCELEYTAELHAPRAAPRSAASQPSTAGRALATYDNVAGAHRFSLFDASLVEECLGLASRRAAAEIVRWAHALLADKTSRPSR